MCSRCTGEIDNASQSTPTVRLLEDSTERCWEPLQLKTVHNCSFIGCPASGLGVLEISIISQERWTWG